MIQISRRFVGQQKKWLVYYCSGKRYSLFFPAGKLIRKIPGLALKPYPVQSAHNLLFHLAGRRFTFYSCS